ncbi:MAG TPA: retropepsin-like aspartic protease [Candidatus Acidoferrum sp.]
MAAFFLLGGMHADAKSKSRLEGNTLRMNVVGGYLIVVKASIGDRQGLNFLLDTGATTSAIDRKLADRLGLATRSSQMVSFDKTLPVRWCVLPELVYGPDHATNLKVVVQDLRYLRASSVVVDGVIGWDLLRRRTFRLDFANHRVVFGAISTTEGHSVPFRESALCLTVPIDLDSHELWMIADTGMRETMFYEPQLEATSYRWQSSISGNSVGGNVESQIVMVPRLRIGAQDLDRRVHVVRSPNSMLLNGIAGYLGIASLHAKQVTFDLDRGVLSWK